MNNDLRDQLADCFIEAVYTLTEGMPAHSVQRAAVSAADAILGRFAVAGSLPEPDTRYHYPNADRWIGDQNSPIVYLASNGQIDFAGPGYWNTSKGDDPLPFAAAIIAAYIKAQDQRYE